MKKCELCNKVARMYCESDDASLCWDCDSRVHTANFLVAKHTRTLLCRACQSPTPWTGSGPKLGPTVSVCEACSTNGTEEDGDEEDEDDDNDDHARQDDDDDDSENQVVPLSLPPSTTSSSSNDSTRTRDDDVLSRPSNARFSYDVTKRAAAGKNGARKTRSWMWR